MSRLICCMEFLNRQASAYAAVSVPFFGHPERIP